MGILVETKVYESPAHGRVMEFVLAGPASRDGSKALERAFENEIRQHQPHCVLINLLGFELPFADHLLGSFVCAFSVTSRNAGRKFAFVASGKVATELEKLLRSTKLLSVFGSPYPDADSALAHAQVTPELAPCPPKEAATQQETPLPPRAWFPEIATEDRTLLAQVAMLVVGSLLIATVLGWLWKPLRYLNFIPALLVPLYVGFRVFIFVRNWVKRVRWAGSFDGWITPRKARRMLKSDSSRYRLHEAGYGGGFDAGRATPASLIEDTKTGELFAVFPPSGYI